ncbi:hypothetical protein [Cryobacterium sp. Y82]|uniref:hypothetical protein n=1 Tax=Cryobacterium sp. Y82 TaxID=2045017 RepID=UPI000CE46A8E|nr:hypothetical protein [Cryobacterium sp. Y82]
MSKTKTSPNLAQLEGASLLDCTLRDGGYYTAWDFDALVVETYLRAMSKLPVSTVELGYINSPKSGYAGKYNFLRPSVTTHARNILRPNQVLGVMFDEKSVSPGDVRSLLLGHREAVGLVRIAVAPTRIPQALELAREIKALGFAVGLNVMYLSKYWSDVGSIQSIEKVAGVIDSFALVDSYGSCVPGQVAAAVTSAREVLGDMPLGFHGHDNLGLALANSLVAAESGAAIIDGTVRGMGRGPGNTRIELLLVHKTAADLRALDHVALDAVMEPFAELHANHPWGTNLVYMISGAAGLPQNEVMDWLGKNRYSIPAIVDALQGRSGQGLDVKEYANLAKVATASAEVLIIGGGSSVETHKEYVREFVEKTGCTIIHANYQHLDLAATLAGDQFVCVAGNAASRLPKAKDLMSIDRQIVSSPPRFDTTVSSDMPVAQVEPLAANATTGLGPISDVGPLALALGAAAALEARSVTLVGFDGYDNATSAEQELAEEVQALIGTFAAQNPEVRLTSATRTRYRIDTESLYSRLARTDTRV